MLVPERGQLWDQTNGAAPLEITESEKDQDVVSMTRPKVARDPCGSEFCAGQEGDSAEFVAKIDHSHSRDFIQSFAGEEGLV